MSIMEMWRANALRTVVLVILGMALSSLGKLPWIVLGLLLLLGGMYLAFRQGMSTPVVRLRLVSWKLNTRLSLERYTSHSKPKPRSTAI